MGNRTRDRVIYIRTDEKLQTEFEKQKESSGYSAMRAVHTDTEHIHVHFIVSNCNVERMRQYPFGERSEGS